MLCSRHVHFRFSNLIWPLIMGPLPLPLPLFHFCTLPHERHIRVPSVYHISLFKYVFRICANRKERGGMECIPPGVFGIGWIHHWRGVGSQFMANSKQLERVIKISWGALVWSY